MKFINFLRNHHAVFHSRQAVFYYYQKCIRIPVSLHPCRHIFLFAYLLAAFIVVVLVDVRWYLLVVSMSISRVTDDAEPLLGPCWPFASLL